MKRILIALLISLAFSLSAFAAVNINTATQQELESLEGIGEVKAKAIINYRKKNGGFKSVDELGKVEGIGEMTLKNVHENVSVSGKTTIAKPVSKPATAKPKAKVTTTKKSVKADTAEIKPSTKKTTSEPKKMVDKPTN